MEDLIKEDARAGEPCDLPSTLQKYFLTLADGRLACRARPCPRHRQPSLAKRVTCLMLAQTRVAQRQASRIIQNLTSLRAVEGSQSAESRFSHDQTRQINVIRPDA